MSETKQIPVTMTVNGKKVQHFVEPRTLLIHFLREDLNITGPHNRLRDVPLRRLHGGNERHVGEAR